MREAPNEGRRRKAAVAAGMENQGGATAGFSTLLPEAPVRLRRGETHPPTCLFFTTHSLTSVLLGAGSRLMYVIKAIITQRWRDPQGEGGARKQKGHRRDPHEGKRKSCVQGIMIDQSKGSRERGLTLRALTS